MILVVSAEPIRLLAVLVVLLLEPPVLVEPVELRP